MRSEYTHGHSPGVALVAENAARRLALSETDATALRLAGLLHDFGRMGVPVALWNKRESLTEPERERMRKHPSLTELVLTRSRALGNLGTLAGLHHERLDGSGYRGISAASLPLTARILAVADAYQTKLEPRPHRGAMVPEAAARELECQATEGKLDRDVVTATLAAAGHESPPTVRGLSNREMGEALFLSPKTVGHHIESIYDKIGVSTRVGATLFALQHGLTREHAG
jgi:HD-GYP domain-containing protein (c-di-GMP phosphodiesterase class II)